MNVLESLKSLFSIEAVDGGLMRRDSELPSFDEQLAAVVVSRPANPWRAPSVREAMGTPGIFRAVSLIANTTGRLVPKAYRLGQVMAQQEAPRLILRPNPRTTPRAFYRDSAFYLATRGECWWWVAKRDPYDDSPLSLVVVPPWEVTVEPNDTDRLRPKVRWLDKYLPLEDMRQITFLPDDNNLYRGVGPLQLCGAAVSVAYEAQQWAANYFAGGISTTNIYSREDLTEAEAKNLKLQYMEGQGNLPRVIPPTIEKIEDDSPDPAKAQMSETRKEAKGDAATMFGVPGALLEYAQSGTSLTYQNVEDLWRNFQEGSLTPNYLEPIEQEMSDLLTNSTISHFDLAALLRSQPLTRAQIYQLLIPLGVMTTEMAQQAEGWVAGDAEYAPVPASPPRAIPDHLPILSRSTGWRCSTCGRKIAEARGVGTRIRCRCGAMNDAA